jgi:hypothetical protein
MDMLREVRRMIREGMAEYKALSYVANAVLQRMAALHYETVNSFLRGEAEGELMFPAKTHLSEIKGLTEDPELSGTDLASMVPQYKDFWVQFMYNSMHQEVRAEYSAIKDEDATTLAVRIYLYYTKKFLDEMKTTFAGRRMSQQVLFNLLWKKFGSSLVYELRHAVDDHRFQDITHDGERVFQGLNPKNSPGFQFKEKYREKKPNKEVDTEEWLAYHKAYLQLPHEVWARFAQFVHSTGIKTEDLNTPYVMMPDGSKGVTYHIRPMAIVIKWLKNMYGWEAIEEKQRRRLIRALSNLWHEEAAWVEANNREVAKYS